MTNLFKKWPVLLSILLLILLIAFPVYALSSDFLTKANDYYLQNCFKNKIPDAISMNCYLFEKVSELGSSIGSLTTRMTNAEGRITDLENVPPPSPTPTPNVKNLKVFDNSGNELGLYLERKPGFPFIDEFFYMPLGKIVVLSDGQIGRVRDDIWFSNTDCTGQAYGIFSDRDYWSKVNEVISNGPGNYYTVERGSGVLGTTFNSLRRYIGGSFICNTATTSDKAWLLTPVTLFFNEPVELPLQVKYE